MAVRRGRATGSRKVRVVAFIGRRPWRRRRSNFRARSTRRRSAYRWLDGRCVHREARARAAVDAAVAIDGRREQRARGRRAVGGRVAARRFRVRRRGQSRRRRLRRRARQWPQHKFAQRVVGVVGDVDALHLECAVGDYRRLGVLIRPIFCTLLAAAFAQVCDHDDHLALLLVDHAPANDNMRPVWARHKRTRNRRLCAQADLALR